MCPCSVEVEGKRDVQGEERVAKFAGLTLGPAAATWPSDAV